MGYKVNLSWKPNVLFPNRKKYRTHVPGDESNDASNKVKVKQSRYRPGVAQRVTGS
jgi:hypothetical protein